MTWLKTDDGYPDHRKVRRLSDGAYRLHHTAQCYVAHDETDGRIHAEDIDEMQHGRRLRRYIPELVGAGLWEPTERGWAIHDYLDYNPSHAQLEAERAAARARQERLRAKRRGVVEPEPPTPADDAPGHGVSHGVTPGEVTRESHHESRPPVPGRTGPYRTGPYRTDWENSPSSSSSPSDARPDDERGPSLRVVPGSGDVA